jgi:hypothetical protein
MLANIAVAVLAVAVLALLFMRRRRPQENYLNSSDSTLPWIADGGSSNYVPGGGSESPHDGQGGNPGDSVQVDGGGSDWGGDGGGGDGGSGGDGGGGSN